MADILDLTRRKKSSLKDRYTLLEREDIPPDYRLVPIPFKKDEIEKFDIMLFHRIMKENYGQPSEVESEPRNEVLRQLGIERVLITRKDGGLKWEAPAITESQHNSLKELKGITGIGLEWRYFLSTRCGGIIQVGTEDKHSGLSIWHLISENQDHPSEIARKEGRQFIDDLLKEAEKKEGQLLNPRREFEKGEGVQLYLLHNVYLYNYGSAELMLESAEEQQNAMRVEFLRYNARTKDIDDPQKKAHMEKFQLGVGMYYAAAISYYFMSLEGFVNLVYHAFLRDEFRDQEFDWEKRLTLDQKIRLMPNLCYGFRKKHVDRKSEFFINFKKLRDYRNQIFHSKIVDSLKYVCLVESGFLYTCYMDKNKKQCFPSHKMNLKREDVLSARRIVDEIVEQILNSMNDETKELTENFIMKNTEVPFWRNEKGKVILGRSQINLKLNEH